MNDAPGDIKKATAAYLKYHPYPKFLMNHLNLKFR